MKANLPPDFSSRGIAIHVVGAGGTGSAFLSALVKLHQVANAVGLSWRVTVWDDDTVSEANVGRQTFAQADVGRSKCLTLVNRVNLTYGLGWKAEPQKFRSNSIGYTQAAVVLVGCVDSRQGRREIDRAYSALGKAMWIDCGNLQTSGQVVLGLRHQQEVLIPSAADLFPEVVDGQMDANDDAPSCSLVEAITRQDPMINQMVADLAATLLWRSQRFGVLACHGGFVDAESGAITPMPIDESYWASLGWSQRSCRKAA